MGGGEEAKARERELLIRGESKEGLGFSLVSLCIALFRG